MASALPTYGQAYEGNLPVDPIRATNYFEPQPAETPYQEQVRILQKQLEKTGRLLNELSVIDPVAYAASQSKLHTYLEKLEKQNPDYGQTAVSQQIKLFLLTSEEQTKSAIANGRRRLIHVVQIGTATHVADQPNDVTLVAYTPLFRKADYRSRRLHIVLPGEPITPLKKVGAYYFVRCGQSKGYVHEGMIQASQQDNSRIGMKK